MGRRKMVAFLCTSAAFTLALAPALLFAGLALAAGKAPHAQQKLVGPKSSYLALGDSLAFGYQPDLNWVNGYTNDLYTDLRTHGVTTYSNLACPGETTTTMIKGGCPFPLLRKYVYTGPQLHAALDYLHKHAGQVSPVTLDIGANNLTADLNVSNCSVNSNWTTDLATVNSDLTNVILPQLVAALTVNGQMTGDLLLLDYYDPYQNICPNTGTYIQQIDAALANDASLNGHVTFVDILTPFDGTASSNPNICNYTWMCSVFKDIHAQNAGYSIMAKAIEQTVGY